MKKFGKNFLVCFLPWFMWMIFGPMEIYMGNINQYTFGYGNFIYIMTGIALLGTIITTAIVSFLLRKKDTLAKLFIFAFAVGSYIQVMFLNTGIDLLGVSADATEISEWRALKNGAVWFAVLAILLIVYKKSKDWAEQITVYGSAFFLAIQAVALLSLMLTADSNAYKKSYENIWYITDEEQHTVSSDENIIVIILDYFSNQYIDTMLAQYPDALDFLDDFTYYDNTDCAYFGTFPSLVHLATGQEIQPNMPVNDWFSYIWSCDETKEYYNQLHQQGYQCYFYTNDQTYLCGQNSASMLDSYIENLAVKSYVPQIDYPALIKTMVKFGGYRMVPYVMKPLLYTDLSEYYSMVHQQEGTVSSDNTWFLENIQNGAMKLDDSSKRYIVQHLTGNHEFRTAADGTEKVGSSLEENSKGCMSIMNAYLDELKELGVYDNSTIIITSDHGGPRDSQSIFFMKKAQEQHEGLIINHAPTSLKDFQATIIKAAGLDHSAYGRTFDEIEENEVRERTVLVRTMDENYPKVSKYDAKQNSTLNVYYAFTYTGNAQDLMEQYDNGPTEIIPQFDSFY